MRVLLDGFISNLKANNPCGGMKIGATGGGIGLVTGVNPISWVSTNSGLIISGCVGIPRDGWGVIKVDGSVSNCMVCPVFYFVYTWESTITFILVSSPSRLCEGPG